MLDGIQWVPVPPPDVLEDGVLYATHEGCLEVSGAKLRCYQLNNGQRVFNPDDVYAFFEGAVLIKEN